MITHVMVQYSKYSSMRRRRGSAQARKASELGFSFAAFRAVAAPGGPSPASLLSWVVRSLAPNLELPFYQLFAILSTMCQHRGSDFVYLTDVRHSIPEILPFRLGPPLYVCESSFHFRPCGCFYELWVLFVGVLRTRALVLVVYNRVQTPAMYLQTR